jgi:hypothetical protein
MIIDSKYYRARLMLLANYVSNADEADKVLLRNGYIPETVSDKFYSDLKTEIKNLDNAQPLSFEEITSYDTWFNIYPEKVAGKVYTTTSLEFPLQIKGSKEDIINMFSFLDKNIDTNENAEIYESVIRYKSDGNTITDSKIWIEKVDKLNNFYKSKKPTINDNYLAIAKVTYNNKSAYIEAGEYLSYKFKELSENYEQTQNVIDNWIENQKRLLKGRFEDVEHIQLKVIELAKKFDIDTTALLEMRQKYFDFLKEGEKEKQIKKQKEAEESAKRAYEKLRTEFYNFKEGKRVSGSDMLLIAKHFKIAVHPRTISAIDKYAIGFQYDLAENSLSYYYQKSWRNQKSNVKINTDFVFEIKDQKYFDDNDNDTDAEKAKRIRIAKVKAIAKLKLLKLIYEA